MCFTKGLSVVNACMQKGFAPFVQTSPSMSCHNWVHSNPPLSLCTVHLSGHHIQYITSSGAVKKYNVKWSDNQTCWNACIPATGSLPLTWEMGIFTFSDLENCTTLLLKGVQSVSYHSAIIWFHALCIKKTYGANMQEKGQGFVLLCNLMLMAPPRKRCTPKSEICRASAKTRFCHKLTKELPTSHHAAPCRVVMVLSAMPVIISKLRSCPLRLQTLQRFGRLWLVPVWQKKADRPSLAAVRPAHPGGTGLCSLPQRVETGSHSCSNVVGRVQARRGGSVRLTRDSATHTVALLDAPHPGPF